MTFFEKKSRKNLDYYEKAPIFAPAKQQERGSNPHFC